MLTPLLFKSALKNFLSFLSCLVERRSARSKSPLVALLGLFMLFSVAVMAQTITTDKLDYVPGEVAYASGTGWPSDTEITLTIHEEPVSHPDVITTTTTDASGNFSNVVVYSFDETDFGSSFTLTATDGISTAVTYFTDGPPAANLDQVRNGSAASWDDPGAWVNGNLNASQSHYAEGMSVAYRNVMTNMPTGTVVTLIMEYDVKHSDKLALDYLTSYDRLDPHQLTFGHISEEIDPTIGITGSSEPADDTHLIPEPIMSNSPVAGQPGISFSNVAGGGQAEMSIWNGDITSIVYSGGTPDLSDPANQSQEITVTFTTSGLVGEDPITVVLGWGGHIASRVDWGFDNGTPRSAGGISGSPYHMRLIDWNLNNLGNQDRSLSADAVVPPPDCTLAGLDLACESSENAYTVTPIGAINPSYTWEIVNNTSGATFVGGTPGTNELTADINAGTSGTYTVKVTITSEFGTTVCEIPVTVSAGPQLSALATDVTCYGDNDGSIDLTVTGTAPFTYLWSTSDGGTGLVPTDEDQSGLSAGTYDVLVTDATGCTSTTQVSITQPDPVTLVISSTNVTCNDDGDGKLTIESYSGTGTAIFSLSTDGGAFVVMTEAAIEGALYGPGVYVIKVAYPDGEGVAGACEFTQTETITQPDPVIVSTTASVDCTQGLSGLPSGTVSVTGSGYDKLELYDASTDLKVAEHITSSAYDFIGLASGSYYVIALAPNSDGTPDACDATSNVSFVEECYWFEIIKVTQGVVDPLRDWSFAIYEGPDGHGSGSIGSDNTLGDIDGVLDFDFVNLDPNQTYTVCEENMAAGWSAIWVTDVNGIQTVLTTYNPNADDSTPGDVGNRCFDIGAGTSYPLVPDGVFTINVDNTYPGGTARTPGYWKNWNHCSGGGQADNAEKNGGWQAGYWLLDDVLNDPGVTLGDYVVTTCENGVNILDQRDVSNPKKKMASDAAYTLAMHLMAFELNQAAGAYHCQLAIDASMEAHQLLSDLGYDGTGNYFKGKNASGSAADKSRALELAEILDRYNNNDIDEAECSGGGSRTVSSTPVQEDLELELEQVDEVMLTSYPNPFRGTAYIEVVVPHDTEGSLIVYTLDGSEQIQLFRGELKANQLYQYKFDATHLSNQLYIYRLQTDEGVITGKLIPQR